MARIAYPSDFDGKNELFDKIVKKHGEDGAASPLTDYDFVVLSGKNTSAKASHDQANTLAEESQKLREKRDLEFEDVDATTHKIGNFLKSKYPDNPRKLSEWGFNIDDSPIPPKKGGAA